MATLSHDDISARLHRGQIFLPGSWDSSCVRAAAYDIRMAPDLALIPDPPEFKTGRYYPRGTKRISEVILQPGDVAFVSSAERLCLPWNLTGLLGTKFSLTAKGIMTLTGTFVDPGYGLRLDEDGNWIAMTDQRLHFLFANVGPAPVVFVPGQEKIASIQFMVVTEPPHKREVNSVGFSRIEDAYLNRKSVEGGLIFFRNMADLGDEIKRIDQKIDLFQHRLSGIEAGSNQIVMFGIYLICVTFLGISLTSLLALIQVQGLAAQISALSLLIQTTWPALIVILLVIFGASTVAWLILKSIVIFFRRLLR